jgi:hypothetical protein
VPQLTRAGSQSNNLTKPGSFQFLGNNRPGLQLIPTETSPQQAMVSETLPADMSPLIQPAIDNLRQHENPLLLYEQDTEVVSGNSVDSSTYLSDTKRAPVYAANVQQLMQVEEDPAVSLARQFVDEVTGVTTIGHHISSPLVSTVSTALSHSPQHSYSIIPQHGVTQPSQFEQATPRAHPQPSRSASVPTNVNRLSRRRKSRSSLSSSPNRSSAIDPYQHQVPMATVSQLRHRSQTEPAITTSQLTSVANVVSVNSSTGQLNQSRSGSFDHMSRSVSGDSISQTTSTGRPTRSSYPEIAPKLEAQSMSAAGPSLSTGLMPMVQSTQVSSMHLQTSSAYQPASIHPAPGMAASGASAPLPSGHPPLDVASIVQQLAMVLTETPELIPKILDVVDSHKKAQQRETQSAGSGFASLPLSESHATSHSSIVDQHQPYSLSLQEASMQTPQAKPGVQQDVSRQDFFSPLQTTPVVPRQQRSVSPPNVQQRSTSSTSGVVPVRDSSFPQRLCL